MTHDYIADASLLSDHVYHISTRSKRRPLTAYPVVAITEPRKSWRDNREARVRYALSGLTCGQIRYIEGVHVQRTHTPSRRSYFVAKCGAVGFERAVADVLGRVRE